VDRPLGSTWNGGEASERVPARARVCYVQLPPPPAAAARPGQRSSRGWRSLGRAPAGSFSRSRGV